MVARSGWRELRLDEFLEGVLCVLAFRERKNVPLSPGVFETALAATMEAIEKQASREKLEFVFRVTPNALEQPTSTMSRSLRRLADNGVLRIHETPTRRAELLLTPDAAYGRLSAGDLSIGFLERAAKILHQRLQVGKIRHSLASLARRNRPEAASAKPGPDVSSGERARQTGGKQRPRRP